VVLPGLVLLPWLLLRRDWAGLRHALHPLGLMVFAVIVLPWLLAMQARFPGFFDYFIMEQHFRRYQGKTFNNAQAWYFYLVVLPLGMLPASLRLPWALRDAWRAGLRSPAAFDVWWMAAVLLFFSLPNSKLVGYILPAAVPTALLLAGAWSARPGSRALVGAGLLFCASVVAGVSIWGNPDHARLGQALREQLAPGDRVVITQHHFFDLRLHARLERPPAVLMDWDDPQTTSRDNWRRELFDAARFAPDRGASVLWTMTRMQAELCRPGRIWLVSPPDFDLNAALGPALAANTVYSDRGSILRRIDAGPCERP